MNNKMLRDIGMSRTDAEYHAGRFKRDRKRTGIWKSRNEK